MRPLPQTYPLQVTLDANGAGTVTLTARGDIIITNVRWLVGPWSTSETVVQSTAEIEINGDTWQGTYSGNNDQSGAVHLLQAGDILTCSWIGGKAGKTAKLTVRGFQYQAGEGAAVAGGGLGAGGGGPGNPVVGGDTLIRNAIKSQNYLTGVQGWAIFASGAAEFLDVTIRGTFRTSSPSGSYILIESDFTGSFIEFNPPNFPPLTINRAINYATNVDFGAGSYLSQLSWLGPAIIAPGAGTPPVQFSFETRQQAGVNTAGLDIQAQNYFQVFTDDGVLSASNRWDISDSAGQYPMSDAGSFNVTVTAGATNVVISGVAFTKTFATAPAVMCQLQASSGSLARWTCRVSARTATTFDVVIEKGASADASPAANVGCTVLWSAVEII